RSGIPVIDVTNIEKVVRENNVEIGIIAVTPEAAQTVYDALVKAGVVAVLNFAPVQLRLTSGVKVRNVDLRINLESLSFHLKSVGASRIKMASRIASTSGGVCNANASLTRARSRTLPSTMSSSVSGSIDRIADDSSMMSIGFVSTASIPAAIQRSRSSLRVKA